jgi:hypothetical protein
MVNTIDSIINIPPRQLSHWNQYKHKWQPEKELIIWY